MGNLGFKISSDQTGIFRYIFPYLVILVFGFMLFWMIVDEMFIFVPIIIFMFIVAFFIGRFYLFFRINDVYINYETKSFEVQYLKHKELFFFTDLKDIHEGMYFVTLKFSNKKIYFLRQLFSTIPMFNEAKFSITDLYAIVDANRLREE